MNILYLIKKVFSSDEGNHDSSSGRGLNEESPDAKPDHGEPSDTTPEKSVESNGEKDHGPETKKHEDNQAKAEKEDIKDILPILIDPHERTFRNYITPAFWREKNLKYKKIREREKQGLDLYELLASGAAPTREYYVLTILSCVIATAGLIQGASATIIGAMIVAPLMTPILAFSLGVVWGDLILIRLSAASILKGLFWAIVISCLITLVIPLPSYSEEIMSRTRPTIFDIVVALASGFVGAYGYANKKISSSLVGIAIAVALMPPLCTIGIGIGKMNADIAQGAAVLFIINLISISLAGAVVFWLMKIQPIDADQVEVNRRAFSQIIISIIILVIISVPLGLFMKDGYLLGEARTDLKTSLEREFPDIHIIESFESRRNDGFILQATVTGAARPDAGIVQNMVDDLKTRNSIVKGVSLKYMKSEPIEHVYK